MNDLGAQFAEAAFQSLKIGGDDTSLVIEELRRRSPLEIRLPAHPTERDLEGVRTLISRAAGGTEVFGKETNDFPSTAAIGSSSLTGSFGASGFLVSPDIVLTAGHCIVGGLSGGIWIQQLGETTFLEPIEKSATYHTRYGEPEPYQNDIGMIRLKAPAKGVEIYPIADGATIDGAKILHLVGYGNDKQGAFSVHVKRTAPVKVRLNPSDGTIGFKDLEFVIGDPLADDGDACERDSGGPVIAEVAGNRRLAGLISRGVNPDKTVCGEGTICLRLDRYVDWIDPTIERLGGQPRPVA